MNESSEPSDTDHLQRIVDRCQVVLAHAWMVRTFVKHSTEVEDFPELMSLPRTVFDVSRSLESRKSDPPAYLHQLRKKIRRLREAATQFAENAPIASTHLNFQQAVISFTAAVCELEELLQFSTAADVRPPFRPVAGGSTIAETEREA